MIRRRCRTSSRPRSLQDAERQRLFGIIEELVKWENSTNEEVLNAARAEILKSTDGNPAADSGSVCGWRVDSVGGAAFGVGGACV